MKKQFIGYNEAVSLKELGFDEPCFKVYDNLGFLQEESVMNTCEIECDCVLERYLAPLYQQAFRWFREKYDFYFNIHRLQHKIGTKEEFMLTIDAPLYGGYFKTYEEAELECLNKLIEICRELK